MITVEVHDVDADGRVNSVTIKHPECGVLHISVEDAGWQQGFVINGEQPIQVFPRSGNSIRIKAKRDY